ncbi:ribonuclease E/G [Kitasatospora sp. NPDC058444]|uniref:Rne/Rng family ribonuclease n=1 Tax=Kitasatospora sp. NPDC058444 TaxID=3346504 RepID=UPI00365C4765
MLDNTDPQQTAATEQNETAATGGEGASAAPPRRRRRAVSRPAGTPQGAAAEAAETVLPAEAPVAAATPAPAVEPAAEPVAEKPVRARRTRKRAEAPAGAPEATPIVVTAPETEQAPAAETAVKAPKAAKAGRAAKAEKAEAVEKTEAVEKAEVVEKPVRARRTRKRAEAPAGAPATEAPVAEAPVVEAPAAEPVAEEAPAAPARRPRRRRVVEAAPVVEAPVEEPQAEEPAVEEEPEEEAAEAATEAPAAKAAAEPTAQPAAAAPAAEAEPHHRVRRRAVRPATAIFQAPVFQEPAPFVAPSTPAASAAAAPQQPAVAPVQAEAAPAAAERAEDEDEFEYSGVGRRRRVRTRVEPTRRKSAAQAPAKAPAKAPVKAPAPAPVVEAPVAEAPAVEAPAAGPETEGEWEEDGRPSRRRRRGGRRRRRGEAEEFEAAEAVETEQPAAEEPAEAIAEDEGEEDDDLAAGLSSSRRRRRRRRRSGEAGAVETAETTEDGVRTVVKVREPRRRSTEPSFDPDEVQSIKGSTRLEAKKQRRREGRELGRRRVPIITEAEFLARRESVERVMVVRQSGQRTQIGVLEDGVLVEHYVNKEQATSYVGNVYLGKVQNVLPSMEAAFVDIGKGRNAVLYAGEVNFGALGGHGGPRRIESVLKSGQSVLVQVSKDPIGHKGARLTSQISLPGRYLVYVPEGSMTGISRKLPENERARLKQILKKIVPDDAGVIVRTAAEGASEEELTRDVQRLQQQWEDIQKKAATGNAPALLYGEPDMTVRVVRDIFNEDFSKVIVSGDEAWKTIHEYVSNVAPDLAERLQRWTSEVDVFATYRIDEQLMKALDRKVWLPSGGSLVIDRTEAMVVIDVNTGKFVGQGGNLEETVTRNNIEAAEEIVRQLRLRDLGGIIVIDFIDMVLESNRDLVLRRLLECLGRDRTKHQVAEVTSLGLVQMTRKRVGQGLLESFSEPCVHCNGRGVIVHMEQPSAHVHAPVAAGEAGAGGGKRRRRGKGGAGHEEPQAVEAVVTILSESAEAVAEPAEPVREEIEGQLALEVPGVEAPAEEVAQAVAAPVVEAPVAEAPAAAPAGRPRRRAVRKATAPAGSPDSAEIVVLQAKAEAALEAALEAAAPAVAETAAEAAAEAPGEPVVVAEAAVVAEAPEAAEATEAPEAAAEAPAEEAPAPKKRAARKTAAKKTAAKKTTAAAKKTTARKTATKRTSAAAKKAAAAEGDTAAE